MDIVSHAFAGAATGLLFGHPVAGALVAVLPDLALGIRRKSVPSEAYNLGHSAFGVALAVLLGSLWSQGLLVFFCLASHIVLDLPTHGKTWAPPLLYPFGCQRFSFGSEWEFFNYSWKRGLILTIFWSITCAALYVTGFHF